MSMTSHLEHHEFIPCAPCIALFSLSFVEILKNRVINGRRSINALSDDFQIHIPRMAGGMFNRGHSFILFLAHFVLSRFHLHGFANRVHYSLAIKVICRNFFCYFFTTDNSMQ